MAREFNGSAGAGITCNPGGLTGLSGRNCSLMFLWKPLSVRANGLFSSSPDNASATNPSTDGFVYYTGSGASFTNSNTSYTSTDGYRLDAWTVTSGGQTRWHSKLKSGGSWTHQDRGVVAASANAVTGIKLAAFDNSNTLTGRIAAMGVWVGTVLSDGQIEGCELKMADWMSLTPSAAWQFPQGSTGATDLTGNGANSTASSGDSDSADEPPSWTYLSFIAGSATLSLGGLTATANALPGLHLRTPTVREGIQATGLWRYYSLDEGVTLLVKGATVTQARYPYQGDLDQYDFVYMGGHDYTVTLAEAITLANAGYGAYLS